MLYAIADATVDHYLDVATELQTDLEELEAEVFSPDVGGSRNTASRIYTFKRQILEFRRATGPLAAPLTRLAGTGRHAAAVPFVDEKAQPFFRDVNDHLTRVNESVEGLDRLVSDILSAHLAQMSVRQNDDMRKISAWAAMAAIPTMVAGIYGMNFEHMPELHWMWSYPALIALMVVTGGAAVPALQAPGLAVAVPCGRAAVRARAIRAHARVASRCQANSGPPSPGRPGRRGAPASAARPCGASRGAARTRTRRGCPRRGRPPWASASPGCAPCGPSRRG